MALRKPIVSPTTASILILLLQRAQASSVELAVELGVYPSQVNAYLHYYRKQGIVEKSGDVWRLTEDGLKYVQERYDYLTNVASAFGIKINKDESRRINLYSEIRKVAVEWLNGHEDCLFIVDFLAFLYFERGKTYFEAGRGLADSLAEALEEYSSGGYVSPFRVQECLAELSQRGVVYIWRGRKVRLAKQLIEAARRQAPAAPAASRPPGRPYPSGGRI
ncbi:hypothetical protein APE_0722 [Aeropyrum pernix ovoid virus 1]|uniref:Uncharacterized protein n=2 Tax=root TaxID=1 RepID=Q9YE48_AERPE|nr:hypothetical protein [Aeropyrum pernix]YP_009177656.1 hypothetical protein ASQ65_gp05 [Aeropyrum pernix ovoid virus 1]BAA79698.1 hypothetical protein APE_0722 [Aeropyrum pernix ovoid virus 1] [Aeropyrum pernix K1]CCD22146.1 TPA: hypothetical protein [Aeropyrum pernix ovoid virus 1]